MATVASVCFNWPCLEVYAALSVEQSADYNQVKVSILRC